MLEDTYQINIRRNFVVSSLCFIAHIIADIFTSFLYKKLYVFNKKNIAIFASFFVFTFLSQKSIAQDPASFTATPFNNAQINLSATANANGDNIVVVFNLTGVFTTPTNG